MIELPTPETDALFYRNGYPVVVDSSRAMQLCEKLEQERDWITEKFKLLEGCFKRAERERDEARSELSLKQQTLTIAEGTLSDLRKQRDEWAAMCGRYKQERDIAEEDATNYFARIIELIAERDKTKRERDEAREKLENEKKWHHQTHKELIEAQCKLLDIEYDKLKS